MKKRPNTRIIFSFHYGEGITCEEKKIQVWDEVGWNRSVKVPSVNIDDQLRRGLRENG